MRLRYIILLLFSTVSMSGVAHVYTNGDFRIEEYTLDNGLTVYLVPNSSDVDVCGTVVVRAGTVDEPDSHRGVANFLKYGLNGGTQKIGAIDWQREKPIYEEIIGLYDSLSVENDRQKYLDLWQRISEKTAEAARFSSSNEFLNLLGELGATDIQDYVDTDYSRFGSNFPPSAMEQWLQLNSERFIDPAFRNFQSRLNIFYEEFNRYSVSKKMKSLLLNNRFYAGTPYARPEKGRPEELTHPSMSAMTEFFDTWYVANNMALVLAGNFDTEEVKPLIEQTFGRLPNRKLPSRTMYPAVDFVERKLERTCIGQFFGFAGYSWYFSGPDVDSEEFVHFKFIQHILSNSNRSGLINQLEYAGLYENSNEYRFNTVEITYCRDIKGSVIEVSASPPLWLDMDISVYYDTKTIVFDQINKLKKVDKVPDRLFLFAKRHLLDEVERFLCSTNMEKAAAVSFNYVYGIPIAQLSDKESIESVTKEDISTFTQKYVTYKRLALFYDKHYNSNKIPELRLGRIEKPATAIPCFNDTTESLYAKILLHDDMPFPDVGKPACSDIVERYIANEATMYYTPNSTNPSGENFTLTLRYEYGQQDDLNLNDMSYVLSRSGIKPGINESARRLMFEELGATVKIHSDYNYFYIDITGMEYNLKRILDMTTVWLLAPWLDRQQTYEVWNTQYGKRANMMDYMYHLNNALRQYVYHGKKSDYLNISSKEDLVSVSYTESGTLYFDYLTDRVQLDEVTRKIMCRPLDMFYRGNLPVDTVAGILMAAPMAEMEEIPMPRQEKPLVSYKWNTVHISTYLPSQLSNISFYAKLHSFRYDDYIPARVFSIYFRSLLDDELRLKRAMALNPAGCVAVPVQPGGECCFSGEMEVDGKNTTQAIELYMNLLKNMPIDEHRFRIAVRTCYSECVRQVYGYDKGKFYNWLKNIFPEGLPVEAWLEELKNMSVYDLQRFYEANIRQLPVQTMVAGDKQHVNAKELRKFGNVKMWGASSLFRDSKEIHYKKAFGAF